MEEPQAKRDWNEIEFLSWDEFRHMAPSILRLEVKRLGAIIDASPGTERTEFHNNLVRARFAIKQFIACLETTAKKNLEANCAEHLRKAIMNLSVLPGGIDAQTTATCAYVLDRLHYVNYRIRLIY